MSAREDALAKALSALLDAVADLSDDARAEIDEAAVVAGNAALSLPQDADALAAQHGISVRKGDDAIVSAVVDLDNSETARHLDSRASGLPIVRVTVHRGGKHCHAWLDVGNFTGRPEVSLVRDTAQGQKRTDQRIVPYRDTAQG